MRSVVCSFRNVVSTVNLGCELKLKEIAQRAGNAEYNPRRFSAVIMRIRNPRTTLLIFQSGKLVCTGAKTVDDSNRAARRGARIIQKLGFPVTSLDDDRTSLTFHFVYFRRNFSNFGFKIWSPVWTSSSAFDYHY